MLGVVVGMVGVVVGLPVLLAVVIFVCSVIGGGGILNSGGRGGSVGCRGGVTGFALVWSTPSFSHCYHYH